tara:strand:- start:3195 stop:3455 length:261 start_codon:yes stop_codon:yes gene_type:complete
MNSVLKSCFGLCLCLLLAIFISFKPVRAQEIFISTDIDIENNQNLLSSKSIDDLLGPDSNFPFDPSNHRDGSNPIKRIGKISDDNL